MARNSHALIAAAAGVIAVIAGLVLVFVSFEPAAQSNDSTTVTPTEVGSAPQTTPAETDSRDDPSTATQTPDKNPDADGEGQGEPGGYSGGLIEEIPQAMEPENCEPTSAGGIRCDATGVHTVTVEDERLGSITCSGTGDICIDITPPGVGSVEYAWLFRGQRYIEWASSDNPGWVLRAFSEGYEEPEALHQWWLDCLQDS